MKVIRFALKKMAEGFFITLGVLIFFGFLGAIAGQGALEQWVAAMEGDTYDSGDYFASDAFSPGITPLFVSQERLTVIEDTGLRVIGKVRNDSDVTWDHIAVELELFDASGALLDEFHDSLMPIISPGSEEHFKLEFFPEEEASMAYASYTVRVVSAYVASAY